MKQTKKKTKISEELQKLAEKAAQSMIESGESIKKFPFGRSDGFFWISDAADKLMSPEEIVVGERKFYFGMFKA